MRLVADPPALASQHSELMAQRKDLKLLRVARAAEQDEELKDPAKRQIRNESTRHLRSTDKRRTNLLTGGDRRRFPPPIISERATCRPGLCSLRGRARPGGAAVSSCPNRTGRARRSSLHGARGDPPRVASAAPRVRDRRASLHRRPRGQGAGSGEHRPGPPCCAHARPSPAHRSAAAGPSEQSVRMLASAKTATPGPPPGCVVGDPVRRTPSVPDCDRCERDEWLQ